MIAILTEMRWYPKVVLIYISPTSRDVENLLKYILAICTPYFEKCLLIPFAHLLIGSLVMHICVFLCHIYSGVY